MKQGRKRIISAVLAMIMCANMAVTAFAEGVVTTGTVEVETGRGKTEQVEVTITTGEATDEDGTQTKKMTATADGYVTGDGKTVTYSSESHTQTDADGISTGNSKENYSVSGSYYTAEGGSETKTEKQLLELEAVISLKPGESSAAGDAAGTQTGTADKTGGTYDYTVTTLETQGKLKVTTTSSESTQTVTGAEQGLTYIKSDVGESAQTQLTAPNRIPQIPQTVEITQGYDHKLLGIEHISYFWPAKLYTSEMASGPLYTDENGTSYYGAAVESVFTGRGLTLPAIYPHLEPVTKENGSFVAMYDTAQQFLLTDANGNLSTAYCADAETIAEHGYSYIMQNVADATYYSKDNVPKIQNVAYNGYWGTAGDGIGSLTKFKAMLAASGQFTAEELARVTDGLALTATQMAIWKFSNHMGDIVFLGAFYVPKTVTGLFRQKDADDNIISWGASRDDLDLLFKTVKRLIATANNPAVRSTTRNTIINTENFIRDMSVKIKGKGADGRYISDISFSLKVSPRSDNTDDLLVTVTDGDGNELAEGRIAGQNLEGETDLRTTMKDGEYTFTDIPLDESGQKITFRITGRQNLDRGVFIYTSELLNGEPSQTLIGLASGMRGVNVAMELGFDIEVTPQVLKTEHSWRKETILPQPTPTPAPPPKPDVPDTGDASALWLTVAAVAAAGLTAMTVLKKKLKEE